jgi:succinate-acetate transporter protein
MESAVARDPTRGETAQARAAPEDRVARVLPITADPGPLGLGAFAMTTFLLSMFNAHLVNTAGEPIVLSVALAYGGLAQLLAGMWEFRTGNTFGAVAFTSYGAFWLSFWAFLQFFAKDITDKTVLGNSVGLYLIAWGIFTSYMFVASLRVSVAVALVFILLAATYIVLGIGNANASVNTVKVGGYIGLATAAAAWYASFAAVVNSTFARVVLPVKDLKRH